MTDTARMGGPIVGVVGGSRSDFPVLEAATRATIPGGP